MGKATIEITCAACGRKSVKRLDNVKATLRHGGSIYCSRPCANATVGSVQDRLARQSKKVDETGCIEWTGYIRSDGYGSLRIDGKQVQAHRAAYEFAFGKIEDGLLVCHRCDNRKCINPEHLFLGTHQDNMKDMTEKNRQSREASRWSSKLNAGQVAEIRTRHSHGETIRALATYFGIGKTAIFNIVDRHTWKGV